MSYNNSYHLNAKKIADFIVSVGLSIFLHSARGRLSKNSIPKLHSYCIFRYIETKIRVFGNRYSGQHCQKYALCVFRIPRQTENWSHNFVDFGRSWMFESQCHVARKWAFHYQTWRGSTYTQWICLEQTCQSDLYRGTCWHWIQWIWR